MKIPILNRSVSVKTLLLFLGLLFNAVAHAGANGTGTVSSVGGGGKIVYFGIEPTPGARAACNIHANYQYVVDITTDTGRAFYSALLTAMSTGRKIKAVGTGQCSLHSQMENIAYWVVWPQ